MQKRILFLISDTGGGQRAAAQAIAEAIHFLHPDRYELGWGRVAQVETRCAYPPFAAITIYRDIAI
jgi:hypothetical protein